MYAPFNDYRNFFIAAGINYFFHSLEQNGNSSYVGDKYVSNLEIQNSFGLDFSIGLIVYSKINFLIKSGYLMYNPEYVLSLQGTNEVSKVINNVNLNTLYLEVGFHFTLIKN